jgi:hypothetical protein
MASRFFPCANETAALPAAAFVPYAGAVPDGGRHGQGGDIRRAPIV